MRCKTTTFCIFARIEFYDECLFVVVSSYHYCIYSQQTVWAFKWKARWNFLSYFPQSNWGESAKIRYRRTKSPFDLYHLAYFLCYLAVQPVTWHEIKIKLIFSICSRLDCYLFVTLKTCRWRFTFDLLFSILLYWCCGAGVYS